MAARASGLPGVYAAIAPGSGAGFARGGTAIVDVLPAAESSLPSGQAAVASIEHALVGSPGVIGVGGDGASLIDFDHTVYGDFPLMLTLIAAATFILLTRAFRSVVLALKAVVFNLISLAAAYGVMTWVFQDGHGSMAIFGVPATGAITMWVPLMVFAFLFGLSMDYEVFILTRIREAYDASRDARSAVVTGLGRTGRLVTSAAAILMLGFVSMSTSGQTDLKILATGLGAGILVDAVVVRCLLVPAMVALFGRANWWLPAWAGRLLRVSDPVPDTAPAAHGRPGSRFPRGSRNDRAYPRVTARSAASFGQRAGLAAPSRGGRAGQRSALFRCCTGVFRGDPRVDALPPVVQPGELGLAGWPRGGRWPRGRATSGR